MNGKWGSRDCFGDAAARKRVLTRNCFEHTAAALVLVREHTAAALVLVRLVEQGQELAGQTSDGTVAVAHVEVAADDGTRLSPLW